MTLEILKEKLKHLYVDRPVAKEIKSYMDECRSSLSFEPEPSCLLVSGDSGAGKSAIFKDCVRQNPVENTSSGIIRRIVSLRVPHNKSKMNIANKLLSTLEFCDPGGLRGNDVASRFDMALKQIERQNVEIVCFDDFHHIVQNGKSNAIREATDLFKNFAKEEGNRICVALALAGTKDVKNILSYEQFERLFCYRVEIKHFDASQKGSVEFVNFLADIDKILPHSSNCGLAKNDMAQKLMTASQGRVYLVMRLIRRADMLAFKNAEQLGNKHFSAVFKGAISAHFPGLPNPFK